MDKKKYCVALSVIACASLAFVAIAGEDGTRKDEQRKLSDVLPDVLAQFVQLTDRDRVLGELSDEQRALLANGDFESDLAGLMEILQPDVHATVGPALLTDAVGPLDRVASKAIPSRLIAGSLVLLEDGFELEAGEELVIGDEVRGGLVINLGRTPIVAEDLLGEQTILPPGGIMLLAAPACKSSCSTSCGSGYYACCYSNPNNSGCAFCHCIPNNTTRDCNLAGGQGSTACSTGGAVGEGE